MIVNRGLIETAFRSASENGFFVEPVHHRREHLLMVSEVMESLDHLRDGKSIDYKKGVEGVIPELADVLIRIMSYCGYMDCEISPTGKPYDLHNMCIYDLQFEVARLMMKAGSVAPHSAGLVLLSDAVDLLCRWMDERKLLGVLEKCMMEKMVYNKKRGVLNGRAF